MFSFMFAFIIYRLAKVAINDFNAEKKYFFNNSNSNIVVEVFPDYYYRGVLNKYIKIRAVAIIGFFISLPIFFILLNQIDLNIFNSTVLIMIGTIVYILLTRLNAFYLSKNRNRSILKTFLILLLAPIPFGYSIILLTPKYPKVTKKQKIWSKVIGIILLSIGILGIILRLYFIFKGDNNADNILPYYDKTDSVLNSFYNLIHILYCVGLVILGNIYIKECKLKNNSEKEEITIE